MAPKKNLALCVPSGRFVDFGFFRSFANSIGQLMLSYNTAVFTVGSPMIFENRNEIARKALLAEETTPGLLFDYMLWIDNDIVFTFEQVQTLLRHLENGKEFASGVYYNPHEKEIKPVAYLREGERYKWLSGKDLNGVMEVDAIGFGFCAFRMDLMRRVFSKHKPRPFNLRQLGDGSLITEDQVFCERAKELGVKIWLDTSIVVRHAKGYLPR